MTKSKVLWLIIIIVIMTVLYLYIKSNSVVNNQQAVNNTETQTLEPFLVPEGWKVYSNNMINKRQGGIAFAYPSHWNITEIPSGAVDAGGSNLGGVKINGDGYEIGIIGHSGLPSGMEILEPEFLVGATSTKVWQKENNNTYLQVVAAGEFVFWIETPSKNLSLPNQILSTVKFSN